MSLICVNTYIVYVEWSEPDILQPTPGDWTGAPLLTGYYTSTSQHLTMSSYYADRSQAVPSWDTLDAADDQDTVDTSEVRFWPHMYNCS